MNKVAYLKKCGSLLFFLFFSIYTYTQHKEGYNWYFGAYVGMTWNTTQTIGTLSGLPTPLPPSAMTNQQEGVFGMSDSEGNLLFYSDGMTVWNKNHLVMSNGSGLTGDNSSAQSGIVIPYPGQSNKYIALTTGTNFSDNLSYSVINMEANGGLGEVTSEKNIQLTGGIGILGESVAAVKHPNENAYWIIAVGKGTGINSALNVWKVTTAGVQTTCFASYTLPQSTNASAGANGYLRFSVDGKYFVWPEHYSLDLFFGTFDPATGTFPIIKVMNAGYNGYGAEFSLSGKILYIGAYSSASVNNINAYKFEELLTSSNPASVSYRSEPVSTKWATPLQLGPDGRIYGSIFASTTMAVIDKANDYDNFTVHSIDGLLPTGTNYQGRLGLPNYMAYFFAPVENTCSYFTDDIWYFGNGGGGIVFNDDGNGNKVAVSASGESLVASAENSLSVSSPGCGSSLIFYSQHNRLYNALHQPMSNGSFSGNASVADGLAACYVGDNKYMLLSVTNCYNNGTMGLESHIIDMNEDNGYGKRISTTTIEASGMSESIELVPVPNTSDEYWLVYNMYNANEIRVRKITGSTVSSVISTLPMTAQGITNSLSFTLKANSTYNMLGLAYPSAQRLALFDFDTNTGNISVNRIATLPFGSGYGVEFSPNGKYVYCATWASPSQITQYSIENNAFTTTFAYGGTQGGGLKIGSDGKLYVKRTGQYMGIIDNPDAPLTTAGYTQNGFDLGNGINSTGLAFSTGLTPPAICPAGLNQAPVAVNDAITLPIGGSVCVPVLTNDYDPNPGDSISLVNVYFLNEADSDKVSISFNLGDSTICVTSKAAAQEGDIVTLIYTIRDDANPIRLCDDAQLKIHLVGYPDNIIESDCSTNPDTQSWSFEKMMESPADYKISNISIPLIGDLDADGKMEIIVPKENPGNPISTVLSNELYVFEVNDNSLQHKHTISTPYMSLNADPYAIANVDGNGHAAIFITTSYHANAPADQLQLIKYSYNSGTGDYEEEWRQAYTTNSHYAGARPMLVDFNGDDIAEVVVLDKIFNTKTGILLADAGIITGTSGLNFDGFGFGGHASGLASWGGGTMPNTPTSQMAIGDIDNDGTPEVIGGNTVYKVNITNPAGTSQNSYEVYKKITAVSTGRAEVKDGATAIVDLDCDGYLDIIVTTIGNSASTAGLYVWNPRTGEVMNQNAINNLPQNSLAGVNGISVAFAGDIDKDGYPEICFTGKNSMFAYKYNINTKNLDQLWFIVTGDDSGATAMSMFDFDQNGEAELVYRDNQKLRIIDKNGNDMESVNCASQTGNEYPVIADIDGDGEAEIIVTGSKSVLIFGSSSGNKWAPARKVWNQFAYNAVNINEDLTIPRYQLNPATVFPGSDGIPGTSRDVRPYNGYLLQQTALDQYGNPLWLIPNGQVTGVHTFNYDISTDSLNITIEVYNAGDAAFHAPFYVTAYQNNTGSSTKHTYRYDHPINPEETATITFGIPNFKANWHPFNDLVIRINDNGNGYNDQTVCDSTYRDFKTNNIIACDDRVLLYKNYSNQQILVTLNDIRPAGCNNPEVNVLSVPSYTGTTSVMNDSIILYTPAANTDGDTLRYSIHCGDPAKADTATVYIKIIEKPDNILDADCWIEPLDFEWDIKTGYQSPAANHHNYAIPLVGDINGDSIPEIITINSNIQYLNILWGHNKTITTIKMATTAALDISSGGSVCPYAMFKTKINGTDKTIIVVKGTGNGARMDAYDLNGPADQSTAPLWTVLSGGNFREAVGIADFDGDGIPEVYVSDRIYNAHTGALLASGTGNKGYCINAYFTIAADVNDDGKLELIAGNEAYAVNIPNKTGTSGNSLVRIAHMQDNITFANGAIANDGYTVVADINRDGKLDIIYIATNSPGGLGGNRMLIAWDIETGSLICKSDEVNAIKGTGIPFVGNIDDDPDPEVVFMVANRLLGYKPDFANKKFNLAYSTAVNDESGSTGMTIFDFNNDRKAEIIYRDQTKLRIMEAIPGNPGTFSNLKDYNCTSTTALEYPVVADVDSDGASEIIVIGNTSGYVGNGFLWIYKSGTSDPWAPARKVWNQFGYHSVNVNEDLIIPKQQLSPAAIFPGNALTGLVQPYNNFLQQQTILGKDGIPIWLAPDIFPDASLSGSSIEGDSVNITVAVINQGEAAIGRPVYVTLYKDGISAANRIKTDSADLQLFPGDTIYISVGIADIKPFLPMVNIIARVNDNGTKFMYQPECDSLNNEMTILNPALQLMMKKEATLMLSPPVPDNGTFSNPASVLFNENIEYKITAVNVNLMSGTVIIKDTLPTYLDYVSGTATPSGVIVSQTSTIPQHEILTWTINNIAPMATTYITFQATPRRGVCSSQPFFINRAWVITSDTIKVPTNNTYHQGACVGLVTFSAGIGGTIHNGGEQALDYKTFPREGIIIAPDKGYRFTGWSHDTYVSLRGEFISAQDNIMHYDTLPVYGNVELRANFKPEEYPIRYYLNGSTNHLLNPDTYTINSGDLLLEEPEKEGDIFIGWTGSNGEEPQVAVRVLEGSTGELEFYANFLHSGKEKAEENSSENKHKIWTIRNTLYIRVSEPGSLIRIYSADGTLQVQQSAEADETTKINLQRGIYIVTINNDIGRKVRIE